MPHTRQTTGAAFSPFRTAWGVCVARLGLGDIEGRNENRARTGTQSSSDLLASLSYSRDFQATTGVGGTVKFFESQIAGDNTSTFAFDLGTVVRVPNQPLWLGASALNMGHGLRFIEQTTPLPLTLAVGAAARVNNALNILVDVKRYVRNDKTDIVTGVEYFLLPTAQLRLGYAAPIAGASSSNNSNLTELGHWKGGFGLGLASYQLDYAISSDSDADTLHRISLSRVF